MCPEDIFIVILYISKKFFVSSRRLSIKIINKSFVNMANNTCSEQIYSSETIFYISIVGVRHYFQSCPILHMIDACV